MTSSHRFRIPSTAILFGCIVVACGAQLGCQKAHEPPKVTDVELERHAQEQQKLREMERSGGSTAK